MRILTRYILSEVTSHAAIGIAVFTFVLFTRDLGHILDLVVRNSAPLPSVAEIFIFTLPVAFTYTIPMGVLVGILIGLSRLAADSEITAMRASGIGVWTFLRVISIFAVTAWPLAMFNAIYLAPESQAALGRLEDRLKTSQASFEVQPRVFYEGFPKFVLYVQDVKTAQGAAIWKGVFIADISNPASPRITLARQGILVSEGSQLLHLHLTNGSTHETDPASADHYQISTFDQTDIPLPVPQADSRDQEPVPAAQMLTWNLRDQARKVKKYVAPWYLIEFHRRFALPTSCLVLALVGIPLGLSSKKGGKSAGFVLTIVLVFAYYSVTLIGVSLARQGKVPPALGAWLANIVFFLGGAFLLWRAERRPFEIGSFRAKWNPLKSRLAQGGKNILRFNRPENAFQRAANRRRVFSASFPMILDDYVLRDFLIYLAMIVASFLMLLQVFTLFELLGDILRNRISPLIVGEYLLNVAPFFLYNVLHLSILLAVLVTLGLMHRSNEITSIKATDINIYRVIVPICCVDPVGDWTVLFRPVLSSARQQAAGCAAQPDQGQACTNLSESGSQMDFWTALDHLLLPTVRSRPRPVWQSVGVSVRPGDLPVDLAGVRRPGALGRTSAALGVYTGLGTKRARFRDHGLPHFRRRHVCRDQRTARVFQKRGAAVF
jgi:LPS export ABC transporter permease LptF